MGKRALKKLVLAGGMVAASASAALAVLPTEAATAFTAVNGMVTDYLAAAWPIVTLFTVGLIGIGLFKKVAKKSAS